MTVGIERAKVARSRTFTDEYPHALPALLLRLVELRALVVGLDSGREVCIELATDDPRGMPVDPSVSRRRNLGQHFRITVYDPREVHDLRNSDSTVLVEQLGQLGMSELRCRALEGRCGHATRCADAEGERKAARGIRERDHARHSEDVGDLVGIGGDGGSTKRQHGTDELVDPQLRGLEVHVRIDE